MTIDVFHCFCISGDARVQWKISGKVNILLRSMIIIIILEGLRTNIAIINFFFSKKKKTNFDKTNFQT